MFVVTRIETRLLLATSHDILFISVCMAGGRGEDGFLLISYQFVLACADQNGRCPMELREKK